MDQQKKEEREREKVKKMYFFPQKSKYPANNKTRIEIKKKGVNGGLFPFQ